MKIKLLVALLASSLWCGWAQGQDFTSSYNFVAKGTQGPGRSFANTTTTAFAISWNTSSTVASCALQVDSSVDGITWGSADLIASQNCAVVGSVAATALASGKNFVRINVTTLTGNGGLNVTLTGVAGGSSSSSSPAVQEITVSENCSVVMTNCYPIKNDGRYCWNATIPNSSSTWTTPSDCPPFVAADATNSLYIAATNANVPGYASQLTSGPVTPTNCAIDVFNNAHSVHVNCTSNSNSNTLCIATSQAGCLLAWGSKETANITAAWNATVAACGTLQYPGVNKYGTGPSVFLIDAAVMNTTSTGVGGTGSNATCSLGNEGVRRGLGIVGKGVHATVFLATPDMNFATWTFGHTGKAGFATVWMGLWADGWMFFGMANSAPTGVLANQVVTEFLPIASENAGVPGNMNIGNIGYMGYGAGSSGLANCVIFWGGSWNVGHLEQDGCGKIGVQVGPSNTANTAASFTRLVSYDNFSNNLYMVNTGSSNLAVDSHGGEFGTVGTATNTCNVSIQAASSGRADFSSFGDHIGLGQANGPAVTLNGALCVGFGPGGNTTGASADIYGSWLDYGTANSTAGEALFVNTGNTAHTHGSYFRMSGAASDFGVFNSGTFYDDGGNTFIGNTAAYSGAGTLGNDGSVTGTAITSAKLVLSGGWGASAAWTALTGNTRWVQGTLTNTGAGQAANPTITYTFPTPFLGTSNLICRAEQVGGTQPAIAGTFTPSSLTATGVVFTYNGTPTVNLTEVVQIQCGVK